MKLTSESMIKRDGSNPIFVVTMPDAKPSALIGKVVFVDDKPYICTGLESSGPARPGDKVGLCVRAMPSTSGQLF